MARVGRYYRTLFKIHRGVNKGDPLPPTIFNMVVDSVICHWFTLVAGEEAGPDGFRRAVKWTAASFYADDGLLTSPRPARLQAALDVLMGLFNRVGLQTNLNKTVGMVCHP